MNTRITPKVIGNWCRELGLDGDPIKTIQQICKDGPVRKVKGSRSVTGRYSSRILDAKIPFESEGPELGFVDRAHEPSAGTRLIVSQPLWLRVTALVAGGAKQHTYDYPPDYFWMTDKWAGFVDCKTEEEIEHIIDPKNPKGKPGFFVRVNGRWTCPAAEKAAKEKGLDHQMFVMNREQAQLSSNLEFLADYFDEPDGNFFVDVAKRIRSWVKETPGILLSELRDRLEPDEHDTLFFMVARREMDVDIETQPLAPNFRAPVYPNRASARAATAFAEAIAQPDKLPSEVEVRPGTKLIIGEKPSKIVSVSGNLLTIQNGDDHIEVLVGELERLLKSKKATLVENAGAPASEIREEAIKAYAAVEPAEWPGIFAKLDLIQSHLNARTDRERRALPPKTRTVYRYLKEYREAEAHYGIGFGVLGLRDEKRPGNPGTKLNPKVIEIIDYVIDNVYLTKAAPTKELAWGDCRRRCKRNRPRLDPPSRNAFLHRFKLRREEAMIREREGDRAAYAMSAAQWREEWDDISVDGEYAWALAHIDHTQVDCETARTADGLNLGRPWLTVMIAPCRRRFLAVVLSYEPPSYRSCMAVIRECVRKHGRLPRIVVTDNGKEFHSDYFDALLHRFKITQKFRPPRKGRFGCVLERLNLTINTRLLHNMPGNTKLTKNPRNLSRSHNPRRLAVMSLEGLADSVRRFCYEFQDTLPNPITGLTPRGAFNQDMARGGPRTHKVIFDNEEFRILTMPTTKTGRAKISRRQGVIINHIPYWCDEIRDAKHHGKKYPVKYNPDDYSEAWIHIDAVWHRCTCREFAYLFKGLTEKEIRIASMEMLAAAQTLKEKRRAITAEKLAEFFRKHCHRPDLKAAAKKAAANKAARDGAKAPKGKRRTRGDAAGRPSRSPGKPAAPVSALSRLPKSQKSRRDGGLGGLAA